MTPDKFLEDNTEFYSGFYRAQIENNGIDLDINKKTAVKDPEGRGRVQARVLGLHSQKTVKDLVDGIPTEHLPWAEQAGSLFGGFGPTKSGLSLIPEVGAWVWVFFDAGNHNKPVYFASVIGKGDFDKNVVSAGAIAINFPGKTQIVVKETYDNGKLKKSKIDMTLPDGESGLLLEYDPNATNKTVATIAAKRVNISGEKIQLGPGSDYLLTTSVADPIQVGGVTLVPRQNIRG